MELFRSKMNTEHPEWTLCAVFSKINMFYFTGTMQDAFLLIPRDREAVLFVLRSYERATEESFFPHIVPITSYRDASGVMSSSKTIHIETEFAPLALLGRFGKHFPSESYESMDAVLADVRSVKSDYELELIKKAGKLHSTVLQKYVPSILNEGMSETDLSLAIYSELVRGGHEGINRLRMFDTEMVVGHVAFGDHSLYPTNFNGPGGSRGLRPSAPFLGNPERRLREGDLIFVDVACAVDGYNTDKTMTYVFKKDLPPFAVELHKRCVSIQDEAASMLVPGAIPEEIYRTVMGKLEESFLEHFMGFGNRKVRFLGHGIGLQIDETPVIAEGFRAPLRKNMVIALEPKKGIKGIGMVGTENTFIVGKSEALCVTDNHPGLIRVG